MDNDSNGRLRGRWQGYTLDTDPDRVRALFERKYGYPPAQVVRSGCILLAGPIGGNGHQRPASLLRRVEEAEGEMTSERARQLALSFKELTK